MKENGIEKLLDLLNEYEPGNLPITKISGQGIDLVISKRYGFIERLVQNDKIDYNKEDFIVNACHYIHNASIYDGLLMLLSIQDNPIEFLISILK